MSDSPEVPVTDPTTGDVRMVPREGVKAFTDQTGWHVATDEQRQVAAENLESGSAGQQALAAGEQVVRTGTLGLAPGMEGWQQREKVLRRESPIISGAAQAAGAVAPALLTGGLAGGAAGAVGLGARGAALAAGAAEGLGGALADEVEQARYESRDVSLGNVMLYGLGGELVGRALPHAFSLGAGNIRRALTGAEAAAGEGLTDALVHTEERALKSQADLATELPKGSPERLEALRKTAPEQYDRMAKETAGDLDHITDLASQMGDTSSSGKVVSRLKETLAEDSPQQMEFFTGVKQRMSALQEQMASPIERSRPPTVDEYLGTVKGTKARQKALDEVTDAVNTIAKEKGLVPQPEEGWHPTAKPAPVEFSLEGKSLGDLKAIDDVFRPGSLEALNNSPEFLSTGRVPQNIDRESFGKGVTVVRDGNDLVLRDGTHRFKVAKDHDLPSIYGTVVDGDSGKVLFQGDLPLRQPKVRWSPDQQDLLSKIEGEVVADRMPPGKGLAQSPGLQGVAKRVDSIIDSGVRRLDRTTDTAESYLITRDIKKQLQQVSKKMSLNRAPQDAVLHDEMRGLVDDAWRGVNEGLKDRSLFGAAADIEGDINSAWSEKVLRGLDVSEGDLARKVDVDFKTGRTVAEYDPKRIRSFLQGDAIDRQLTQGKLEQVLEGAEEMAAAHERHGTWNADQIKDLRDAVGRVREKLSLADELHAAKTTPVDKAGGKAAQSLSEQALDKARGYAVNRAAGAAGAAAGGLIGGPVGAALGWGVGELAQTVGQRLVGLDQAGRAATKQAARNLAGVGLGYAQRVAGDVGRGIGGAALASGANTALSRFTGDYPDAQASFEAKQKLLDQHATQPDVLYETLGHALGDLPRVRPDLFQVIAKRTGEKIRFVQGNLPPGLEASLTYPTGKPMSTSQLRDFATLWNTVFYPHTVVDDINGGTATRQQMQLLQKSDPELYSQLSNDIKTSVSEHFKDVPTSTKVQLGMLLGDDRLAGPFYSSDAARYVGDAMKAQAAQKPQGKPSGGSPKASASATPAGINAIQTSVTNRQAA